MRNEVIEFNKTQRKDTIAFRAGDVVKVHRKIKEGEKERIQIFEGMVIAMKGGQSSSPMMTIRKVSNGVGIEIIVPIFSPTIEKIELVKRAKVRRSKLYFVRDKAAKALRFKYTDGAEISPEEVVEEKNLEVKEVAKDTEKAESVEK
ncbi:MAG: 50S ribosomal protein L19 [Candidatus Moraniibacteriota bacterium]|jgi:large subunit ribosomal protein L19